MVVLKPIILSLQLERCWVKLGYDNKIYLLFLFLDSIMLNAISILLFGFLFGGIACQDFGSEMYPDMGSEMDEMDFGSEQDFEDEMYDAMGSEELADMNDSGFAERQMDYGSDADMDFGSEMYDGYGSGF